MPPSGSALLHTACSESGTAKRSPGQHSAAATLLAPICLAPLTRLHPKKALRPPEMVQPKLVRLLHAISGGTRPLHCSPSMTGNVPLPHIGTASLVCRHVPALLPPPSLPFSIIKLTTRFSDRTSTSATACTKTGLRWPIPDADTDPDLAVTVVAAPFTPTQFALLAIRRARPGTMPSGITRRKFWSQSPGARCPGPRRRHYIRPSHSPAPPLPPGFRMPPLVLVPIPPSRFPRLSSLSPPFPLSSRLYLPSPHVPSSPFLRLPLPRIYPRALPTARLASPPSRSLPSSRLLPAVKTPPTRLPTQAPPLRPLLDFDRDSEMGQDEAGGILSHCCRCQSECGNETEKVFRSGKEVGGHESQEGEDLGVATFSLGRLGFGGAGGSEPLPRLLDLVS
ncbi:hypothetical protein DFH08DRAFT_966889 [Mycena albidolilacea]|uniref:Uncharacterized protein n=1 Tax=Mycena albidolilacea TaxID=1033008 RepID=A0AAD6ZNF5_9AGAR|nr:hypothetical protein DFH08DRAFT_966889 [Mycena albidolilacea]